MRVFVYGTLRKGKHNHGFLKNAKFLGDFHTGKGYSLYITRLPFLVPDKNGPGCYGELYEVSPTIMKKLDMLEGVPDFYYKEVITVYDDEVGSPVEGVYVYLYPNSKEFRNISSVSRYI